MRYFWISFILILFSLNSFTQVQDGFISINNGKIYYQKTGSGPPLVFLHGICLDHRMWEQQVNYFSNSFTCITMDLRGFGRSSTPEGRYSFHEDIHTLLDSLTINEPVVLVALSMGGRAAVNFALAYSNKTKALILADVMVDGYALKDFTFKPYSDAAKEKGIDAANRLFLDHSLFYPARKDSAVFKQLQDMILSYSGWQWTHSNPMVGLDPPAIQQLQNIKAPTLIITGENDIPDFQEIAEILHKNIIGSVKENIPNAGHMCNMEKPGSFNILVSKFLGK